MLPPSALSAMLVAALGLTTAVELCSPLPSPQSPPLTGDPPAAAAPAADLSASVQAWSAAILQRPLFRPDRRPLAPDAAVTATLPRLSAIIISSTGGAAIFSGDDGKAIAVTAGGVIDGYRIATIGPGEVKITGPAGDRTLHPQFAPDTQSATGPAPFMQTNPFLNHN